MSFLRRGPKKSFVKVIKIESEGRKEQERTTSAQDEYTNLHQPEEHLENTTILRVRSEQKQQEIEKLQKENERLKEARMAAEDCANYFENLLNDREAELLSLSTRVETLMKRNNELEENHCSKLYQAKTEYMINLEMELKRVREESSKIATSLQRKVKKLKDASAKSKQEYALKLFALKDENNRLLQENEALQGRLRLHGSEDLSHPSCSPGSSQYNQEVTDPTAGDDTENGPRSKLIVQLSQQVASLDVENQELKQELKKANKLLNKFRVMGKTREVSSKPQYSNDRPQLCVSVANLDIGNSSSRMELLG